MKVLVIGDVILDRYIYGTSTRLSPEAPVPVVTHNRTEETIGGAGLVHSNLLSLGVDSMLFNAEDEPVSIKTRVICDGHYITRIDNDKHADGEDVLRRVREIDFSTYDYVIMSDYNKGYLDESIELIKHFNKFGCKVIVDPKDHATHYEGAWLVKPNYKEFGEFGFTNWRSNIITTMYMIYL
jgi:bifunctional ADP-heptose synthase (sugar kinase/adenylyltransferase)